MEGRRVLLEAAHELLWRGGVAQIHRRELEAAIDEVRVSVGEPGEDHAAVGAQHLRRGPDVARDLRRISDGQDLAVRDRDGPGLPAAGRESGPDRPAPDDQVGFAPAAGERQDEDREDGGTTHGGPPNGDE